MRRQRRRATLREHDGASCVSTLRWSIGVWANSWTLSIVDGVHVTRATEFHSRSAQTHRGTCCSARAMVATHH
jgi:hypothetical protein